MYWHGQRHANDSIFSLFDPRHFSYLWAEIPIITIPLQLRCYINRRIRTKKNANVTALVMDYQKKKKFIFFINTLVGKW